MASSTAQIHALGASTPRFTSAGQTSKPSRTLFFGQSLGAGSRAATAGLKLKYARSNNARRFSHTGPLRIVAEKVVGIDLGTTNSTVAAMEGGKPTIVTNAEGQRTTPSVVAYTKNGDTENGNVKLEFPAIGKQFAAEEISAQVLRKLVEDASKFLNDKVTKAVVTVPAYFNDSQRTASNVAFWLGKKESEYQPHRWTVYVRGATDEDISVVVKRAVFQLHSSFNNPTRIVDVPPFELSECGWGEFEIVITLHFHNDVCNKPLHL